MDILKTLELNTFHNMQDVVDFAINASFEELQRLLAEAVGGLHTMLDEHFGISIVEYMAAGTTYLRKPILLSYWSIPYQLVKYSAPADYLVCDSSPQKMSLIWQPNLHKVIASKPNAKNLQDP